MLYIYLHEDSHIRSCDISTFHDALSEHYPEYKFVGLRGVQKAHQQLTTPMMGGKRMIDMGQDKRISTISETILRRHNAVNSPY